MIQSIEDILNQTSDTNAQFLIRQAYDLGLVHSAKSNAPKAASRAELIDAMLADVEEDLEHKGQENEFILSLREQFDRQQSLSPKQLAALQKFYDRIA